MSLETHISGSEDRLIDGLHFGSRNTASYIVERTQATFHPTSASAWQPSGVRLLRFNLADVSGWLDPGSVRLCMSLNNQDQDNVALAPITDSPLGMIRRMRILASGSAVLEDIEHYNRVYQLMAELQPGQRRYNNISEEWGGAEHTGSYDVPFAITSIPAGGARQLCVKLMSGVLGQGRYLPLHLIPLTLELELDDKDAAFQGVLSNWSITRPRLLADVCTLDQALDNSYSKHLLDGRSLPLYTTGMYSVLAPVPSTGRFSFPIARAFSRLKAVFVTFFDGAVGNSKWTTRFLSPLAGSNNIESLDTFSWNITLGSQRWPSFDCESHQESFYRMRQAVEAMRGDSHIGISSYDYRTLKFLVAQHFEKAPGSSAHTGVNTRSGAQLQINCKNCPANTTLMHVILFYDQIVNVSAAGAEVLD